MAARSFHLDELRLESGAVLAPLSLAYETWGSLNAAKDNAVLLLHALTGDSHASSGGLAGEERGWWEDLVGPGKAIDTRRWYVVCSNVVGGCQGSTGPASENPATGRPYGLAFPLVSIRDMVQAQARLLDHLGVERLAAAVGGSMGGMQALAWLGLHPGRLASAVVLATAARHSPQQIAFQEVGRQAVMADPDWAGGAYTQPPARGLAVARMIGHITYMSDHSMAAKFGRSRRGHGAEASFSPDFEVEGYLRHRGDSFVRRFDANSYLYVTKAVDDFDAFDPPLSPRAPGAGPRPRVLVASFKSDWLYPAYQGREIATACRRAGLETSFTELESTWGHDAFLLETERLGALLKGFLERPGAAA